MRPPPSLCAQIAGTVKCWWVYVRVRVYGYGTLRRARRRCWGRARAWARRRCCGTRAWAATACGLARARTPPLRRAAGSSAPCRCPPAAHSRARSKRCRGVGHPAGLPFACDLHMEAVPPAHAVPMPELRGLDVIHGHRVTQRARKRAGVRRARAGGLRGGARGVRQRPGAHLWVPGHRRAQQPAQDRPGREAGAPLPIRRRGRVPVASQAPASVCRHCSLRPRPGMAGGLPQRTAFPGVGRASRRAFPGRAAAGAAGGLARRTAFPEMDRRPVACSLR